MGELLEMLRILYLYKVRRIQEIEADYVAAHHWALCIIKCKLPSEGQHRGVLDFLSTEISTSNQRKFNLIIFVETPGLVDGDMVYLFDVNETILWLGGMSDLILVRFDPVEQALCKRTLDIVQKLNRKHAEKMRFYLTKSDDAGNECDRQRVMMQIVQELCSDRD